jgi:pyruvate dehydrogenase E2 component (dihydrolipoamide acetyltransferase)
VEDVLVPDIGDFQDVPVIEIAVSPGDKVVAEDPLVTLESDKATMDVPSPAAGVVKEMKVKLGDTVSEGALILTLEVNDADTGAVEKPAAEEVHRAKPSPGAAAALPDAVPAAAPAAPPCAPRPSPTASLPSPASAPHSPSHATPSVRHFAREAASAAPLVSRARVFRRYPRWTSRSSATSRSNRSRASRRFPVNTCAAPG